MATRESDSGEVVTPESVWKQAHRKTPNDSWFHEAEKGRLPQGGERPFFCVVNEWTFEKAKQDNLFVILCFYIHIKNRTKNCTTTSVFFFGYKKLNSFGVNKKKIRECWRARLSLFLTADVQMKGRV